MYICGTQIDKKLLICKLGSIVNTSNAHGDDSARSDTSQGCLFEWGRRMPRACTDPGKHAGPRSSRLSPASGSIPAKPQKMHRRLVFPIFLASSQTTPLWGAL
jgi:hypothetical protein